MANMQLLFMLQSSGQLLPEIVAKSLFKKCNCLLVFFLELRKPANLQCG